jgi:hypothetical protein
VFEAAGNQLVGIIACQWSGCCKEFLTNGYEFGITFHKDLEVNIKAVLLGAVFLIVRNPLVFLYPNIYKRLFVSELYVLQERCV